MPEPVVLCEVFTRNEEDGWCARNDFFRIEAEHGETEEQAINEVVGACLIALGHRPRPPRRVWFKIVRE